MKNMLQVLLLCFLCTIRMANALPDADGKPWDSVELDRILNGNLVHNSNMHLAFPKQTDLHALKKSYNGKPIYPIAPCWWSGSQMEIQQGQQIIVSDKHPGSLYTRAYDYQLSGNEGLYRITIGGVFKPEAKITFSLELCDAVCEEVAVPLQRVGNDTFAGHIDLSGQAGKFFRYFIVGAGDGVQVIRSLSVSSQMVSPELLMERDRRSEGLCYPIYQEMVGEVSVLGLGSLFAGLLATFLLIGWLFRGGQYFYALVLACFFMGGMIGLVPLYWGWSVPRIEQGLVQREILLQLGWMAMAACFAAVMTCYGVHQLASRGLRRITIRKLDWAGPEYLAFLLFLILIGVYLGGLITQIAQSVDGFSVGNAAVEAQKALYRNAIAAPVPLLKPHQGKLLFYYLPIFVGLFLLHWAMETRKFKVAVVVVGMTICLLILGGEKAPLIWYLIALLFIFCQKRDVRGALTIGLAGVVLFSWFILWKGSFPGILLLDRAVLGGMAPTYHAWLSFPDSQAFLEGRSLSVLGIRFGSARVTYFDLDLYLWQKVFASSYFSHLTGTAIGAVWVQGYANYGVPGALAFASIFGAFIAVVYNLVYWLFSRRVATPLLGWIVFNYASLAETNLNRYVFDYNLVSIVLITIVLCMVLRTVFRNIEGK